MAAGGVEIVAAVFLPPLAVFLRQGIGTAFWIALALTVVAWVPGVAFALVVLVRPDLLPPRWLAAAGGGGRT